MSADMKELVDCYKQAQEKQGTVPRFRPSPPKERTPPSQQPPLPEERKPVPSTVSLEDIHKLYGQAASAQAPKTPQATHELVDLCSPESGFKQGSTGKPPDVKKDAVWKYQNDLSGNEGAGVMIRFHPDGRQEHGRMSTPKGAAWQIATFENGDSIDANNCLFYVILCCFIFCLTV